MANYFIPRPPPSIPYNPPQDPPFGGGGLPGFGPLANGYVQAPQFLQGRPPGATGFVGPQEEAVRQWYLNTQANAGVGQAQASRQANIYGLPFSIASAMGRAAWGQGAPYVGMAAPLPIRGSNLPTVSGAAAPFNPNRFTGQGMVGQGMEPFNPLNPRSYGLTPEAITGGPIDWSNGPGYNWGQTPPLPTPTPTTGVSVPETRQPSASMYPWQTLSNQMGVVPPAQGQANSQWWNPLTWGGNTNTVANNGAATQAAPTPAGFTPGAGAAGYGNANNFGTTAPNSAPGGAFNPFKVIQNTVGAMQDWQKNVSQYAGMTPKAGASTGAGNGAGGGTSSGGQQGDTWMDNQGRKRHKDPYIDYAYRTLDSSLGDGFTDQFIGRMGVDPITFYQKPFLNEEGAQGWQLPDARGDKARSYLLYRAADAAEKDARFLPSATARWQELHGNTPIPPEQFDKWWKMSQGGYYTDQEGRPYGVA